MGPVGVFCVMLAIASFLTWIMLLIVIPIAQKLASFSLPPWRETWWKLAVVSLAMNGAMLLLDPVHFTLGWLAGFIVQWILLAKWFDVDGFGLLIILVISLLLRFFAIGVFLWALVTGVLEIFGVSIKH